MMSSSALLSEHPSVKPNEGPSRIQPHNTSYPMHWEEPAKELNSIPNSFKTLLLVTTSSPEEDRLHPEWPNFWQDSQIPHLSWLLTAFVLPDYSHAQPLPLKLKWVSLISVLDQVLKVCHCMIWIPQSMLKSFLNLFSNTKKQENA